ncbi:hypothetical protein EZ313_15265 [Ramlibacter henchirensis]|uniref:Uncharacterized protein n=1 Tax=Ramlibacter henchirensis TaxID=204072 RepID=A0A4Z0BX82_9BURK|nr:hypothetical protein [Ramlibacter henchirensis]TFZ02615.1 hypothetical protein EZ313_15265 [Ramlibacter henchirensis]
MKTREVIAQLSQPGLEPAAMAALEAAFAKASDEALEGDDAASAQLAIASAQIAMRLGIARKALTTAAQYANNPRAEQINRTVAQSNLLDALASVGRLVAYGHGERKWDVGTPAPEPHAAAAPSTAAPRIDLLTNICRHHREHERFYAQDRVAVAADLQREANKLKVVAEAWRRNPPAQLDPAIDFSDPVYAPAGCTDLNELNAISMIGVLFMEGEAEPIEIKVLKAKLTALAAAWRRAGEWLAAKMEAAWDRERAMYEPALIAVAHQRYNTIVVNWRGSRERQLAARVLEMALRVLEGIPFEPRRLREDRAAHATRLHEAAAILAAAAQLVTRTAADLADNDPNWTECIRHLEQTSHPREIRT